MFLGTLQDLFNNIVKLIIITEDVSRILQNSEKKVNENHANNVFCQLRTVCSIESTNTSGTKWIAVEKYSSSNMVHKQTL